MKMKFIIFLILMLVIYVENFSSRSNKILASLSREATENKALEQVSSQARVQTESESQTQTENKISGRDLINFSYASKLADSGSGNIFKLIQHPVDCKESQEAVSGFHLWGKFGILSNSISYEWSCQKANIPAANPNVKSFTTNKITIDKSQEKNSADRLAELEIKCDKGSVIKSFVLAKEKRQIYYKYECLEANTSNCRQDQTEFINIRTAFIAYKSITQLDQFKIKVANGRALRGIKAEKKGDQFKYIYQSCDITGTTTDSENNNSNNNNQNPKPSPNPSNNNVNPNPNNNNNQNPKPNPNPNSNTVNSSPNNNNNSNRTTNDPNDKGNNNTNTNNNTNNNNNNTNNNTNSNSNNQKADPNAGKINPTNNNESKNNGINNNQNVDPNAGKTNHNNNIPPKNDPKANANNTNKPIINPNSGNTNTSTNTNSNNSKNTNNNTNNNTPTGGNNSTNNNGKEGNQIKFNPTDPIIAQKGEAFCKANCVIDNVDPASQKKCLQSGVANCNSCKFNQPITPTSNETHTNADKICKIFCNKVNNSNECKFFQYTIKIDKKEMDPKILSAFGLNGLKRFFKRKSSKDIPESHF